MTTCCNSVPRHGTLVNDDTEKKPRHCHTSLFQKETFMNSVFIHTPFCISISMYKKLWPMNTKFMEPKVITIFGKED